MKSIKRIRVGLCVGALGVVCGSALGAGVETAQGVPLTVVNAGPMNRVVAADGRVVHETASAVSNAQLVEIPGSRTIVAMWDETDSLGNTGAQYTYTTNGVDFAAAQTSDPVIALRNGSFDPVAIMPIDSNGSSYLVQFRTQPLEAYLKHMETLGARVHKYVPGEAYLVTMPADVRRAVESQAYVRWVGSYSPRFRTESVLLDVLAGDENIPAARYSIMVLERGGNMQGAVAARVEALGGSVDLMQPGGYRMEATLTGNQLRTVVGMDEVMFVDRWTEPGEDMDLVRASGGAEFIVDTLGFEGEGVRGEVMDGNVFDGHVDFQANPPVFHGGHSGSSRHGTATYGIVFADGSGSAQGTGLMPHGQGIFGDYHLMTDRYAHTAELVASPYNAVFQSNSWGSGRTEEYTTTSAGFDDILFLNDLLVTQSQSNAGTQRSRPQAWAKNTVSVGGVNHFENTDDSDDCWCGGASIGPASDGRIKPDLVFYYDSIFTTDNDDPTDYRNFCCTSAATPVVAGHFGIFFQMWHAGLFGNPTGDTVFESRPHMSTAKAMMINTARQYAFSGGGDDLRRSHQGWGLPDVQSLYEARDTFLIVDETEVLTSGDIAAFDAFVVDGTPALKATMVYTDPMGNPASLLHRINDLDLKVVSPSGVVYHGNIGLSSGVWSVSGGVPNNRDTVENIFVENPEAGIWNISVHARVVAEDAHTETPGMDVDFALVVSGVTALDAGECPGDLTGDGIVSTRDLTVLIGQFGTSVKAGTGADFTGDGVVTTTDLTAFLSLFGTLCD